MVVDESGFLCDSQRVFVDLSFWKICDEELTVDGGGQVLLKVVGGK